ncbi:hypothetical protein FGG08_002461 [Glutinoglossum americanum]|uniref:Uncharacterized protein n=1 Tax=Glutinoglossum americanum TaxID=1670608 RepID=A0A9P8L4G3_9PEZI|nr:hypothetical protein FGG08_002461 [Glutinoglossum americanum]
MTDAGRKSATDQIQEKVTPDSQKSTFSKVSESISGTADNFASSVQPKDTKSTGQKITDSTRSTAESAQKNGSGWTQSVKNTAGDASQTASEKLGQAANYMSGDSNTNTK